MDRSNVLKRLYHQVLDNEADLTQILAAETGKPYSEAEVEVPLSACFFDGFADKTARVCQINLSSVVGRGTGDEAVIWGIMISPEFPLAIGARKLAGTLAAGCAAIVRPDCRAPFSIIALAVLSERASLPKGILNVVLTFRNTRQSDLLMSYSAMLTKFFQDRRKRINC